jgi:hypothetical protein
MRTRGTLLVPIVGVVAVLLHPTPATVGVQAAAGSIVKLEPLP